MNNNEENSKSIDSNGFYESRKDIYAEHGISDGNIAEARQFLYYNNWVAFFMIVIGIIVAQFWFQIIERTIRFVFGDEYYIIVLLLVGIIFSIIFIILAFYVFKVPLAAGFTL